MTTTCQVIRHDQNLLPCLAFMYARLCCLGLTVLRPRLQVVQIVQDVVVQVQPCQARQRDLCRGRRRTLLSPSILTSSTLPPAFRVCPRRRRCCTRGYQSQCPLRHLWSGVPNTPRRQVARGAAAVFSRRHRASAAAGRVRGLRTSRALISLYAFDDVVPQVQVPEVAQAREPIEARYLIEAQDLRRQPGIGVREDGRWGQRKVR